MSEDKTFRSVLDHGFVRLVDYMGSDLSIVRAARVSYNADWRVSNDKTSASDDKLIRYLLSNKHTSPFEAVVFTLEIKCPIFVLRQWARHRTQAYNDGAGIGYEEFWSYNEVSARYTELPEEFYVPQPRLIGKQSVKDKQQRDLDETRMTAEQWEEQASQLIEDSCQDSYRVYKALLERGVPRELARGVLALNIYTRLFATVNLHNLLLWLKLRLHSHAQYEIRVYAEAVLDLIKGIVPVTVEAFNESLKSKEAQ